MKVLITGGAGFIGAHLCRMLAAQGVYVDLLDDFSRGRRDGDLQSLLAAPGVGCLQKDLLVPGCLDDLPDDYALIFHFAAIVGVRNVIERPNAVLRNSVNMVCRVLDLAFRQRELRRLIFASTSEVYAGSPEHLDLAIPTPETVPIALPDLTAPRTSYLLSKIYGEALCHQSGLPYTIVRPHNIYGPRMGMAHVIPELIGRTLQAPDDGSVEVHCPNHQRAFCYISDAIEQIHRLALAEISLGGTYNIGNQAEEIVMRELAERIIRTVGRSITVISGTETPGSPVRRCPDMSRTQAATGYVPQVGLDQGLADTCRWYRCHGTSSTGMAA